MNFKKIIIIYKKELLDLLRDKRTVITSLVLPVVLYPLLMIGFSSMMTRQESKLEKQTTIVYVKDNVMNESSLMIEQELANLENVQIMDKFTIFHKETFLEMIEDNSIQALIEIQDSTSSSGFNILNIFIYYNRSNEISTLAYNNIFDKLKDIELELIGKRLQTININEEILNAVEIKEENVAPPEKMFGFALGKFLPYLLIILTLSSASVIASDLVAGEKERGTLETILVSAAHRNELVIGKYLTIITISITTVLLNLFSMFISFRHILSQADANLDGFQLPLGNFALILVLMLPFITLFSAILLSISTYSRNIKEAQSYQMPLLFGSIMLSMVSFLPGFELTLGFALIPIVNFSLLIRDIMMSDYNVVNLFVVIGSTIILDIIMVTISIKLFHTESVLFRTSEEKSLKFWGKDKKNVFSPQFVMFFFVAILLALYYLGGSWQAKDLMNGLMRTEILLILLPTIFVLKIAKVNKKKILRLNYTNPLNFVLIAVSSIPIIIIAIILAQLINMIYPLSESYMEAMNNLISVKNNSLWKTIFVVAFLPAVCEEIMFRGYIINAFIKKGFWKAIIITGILFGIFHMDIFRLLPVTLLGIWMGFLLLKTKSILVPMLAHFLNNSLAILISNYGESIPLLSKFVQEGQVPFLAVIPAILILIVIIKTMININSDKIFQTVRS